MNICLKCNKKLLTNQYITCYSCYQEENNYNTFCLKCNIQINNNKYKYCYNCYIKNKCSNCNHITYNKYNICYLCYKIKKNKN